MESTTESPIFKCGCGYVGNFATHAKPRGGWCSSLAVLAPEAAHPAAAEQRASFRDQVLAVCAARGWSLHWTHRSAYLHLEASELTEAVRGKRGSTLDESADVLITLLALSPHDLPEIEQAAWRKLVDLTTKPPYAGEEGLDERSEDVENPR